jgi:uncharacterized protein YqjF (DUF2071 family)
VKLAPAVAADWRTRPAGSPSVLLTAEWRNLAMLNYLVEPSVLAPLVPAGTELDQWNGATFLSVVGFMFLDTRLFGIPIPFHRNFEEVNLRFYVRRRSPEGWRRGVVFVKELVPRMAVAWAARALYNEKYKAVPMSHRVDRYASNSQNRASVSYSWQFRGQAQQMTILTEGESETIGAGTQQEFITEHYWGYSRQRSGGTLEYEVEHPKWRVWLATETHMECDIASLYGEVFKQFLSVPPASAFVADGSPVTVHRGVRIT